MATPRLSRINQRDGRAGETRQKSGGATKLGPHPYSMLNEDVV